MLKTGLHFTGKMRVDSHEKQNRIRQRNIQKNMI